MIDRESVIERSIESYLRQQLFGVRAYPEERVEMLDAFPTDERMTRRLDKNYIAIGYDADDGGRQAELGSTLVKRRYTIDFYVFGVNRVWGKNLANVVRFSLESDGLINLIDPRDGTTVLGTVDVEFASTQRVRTPNPRPWEENCWITRLRVEDYFSSAAGG